MKQFNSAKFCKALVDLRGSESQELFAPKLNVNRSTLSLLENGRQIPTIEILSRVCNLAGTSTEDYFTESKTDALVYLMGCLDDTDRVRLEEMADRIRIREKYELLAKRGTYVND